KRASSFPVTGQLKKRPSPGVPTVSAGPDQVIEIDDTAMLGATISAPNGGTTINWRLYSGPAAVQLTNPNTATANVSFSASGSYLYDQRDRQYPRRRVRRCHHQGDAAFTNGQHFHPRRHRHRAECGIAGFIINGDSPKPVMVRALGPSLTPFGVDGGAR